ncbi:MAG: M1 family metallopeptidase, partial [Chitinophagaceae bacterium]
KADTLRGSLNENRDWWDVLHYDINVTPDFNNKSIKGIANLKALVLKKPSSNFVQLDLQQPLLISTVLMNDVKELSFTKEENVYLIALENEIKNLNVSDTITLTISYSGKPQIANNPPWDGGWIWKKDKLGRPFVSVACQGLGASSWYPCKDHQSDEPQHGATLHIIVPDSLIAIGNGVLKTKVKSQNQSTSLQSIDSQFSIYTWQVKNPINTYNIVPYIGNYVNITDTFMGIKGKLDLNYWVLDYNKEKALQQFTQVKQMLRAFEYWFGAYPFYEDGYKLVESPHLGMEHQSNIAYGNKFNNGYLGRDLSGSGWGLKWDFIIVHESGHEWFANNITTADIADMWVHEGFTCYSETLFTEYYYGKEAGNEYCKGIRKNIRNDKSIIGPYGVNKEGSGDMYYKAANMIHSIRNAMNDDEKFRKMLVEMNTKFYHSIVTTQQIENFINEFSGINFNSTFNQYLRTTNIPNFEYYFIGKKLHYRYTNCVDEFDLPITIDNKTINPTNKWQKTKIRKKYQANYTKEKIENLYLLDVKLIPQPE